MTFCDDALLFRAGSASDRRLGPALALGARNHELQVHRTWATPSRAMVIE
jgi:hypothetical protein